MRRTSGRPADTNHRCALRSSHSSYSGPVQGRLAGRAIAAIDKVAIVVGWRWEKETQATKLPEFKKRWVSESYPESCPNHYPNHTSKLPNSEPWYICKIRTCVLWALFFATISPRVLLLLRKNPTTAPCSAQQHPSLAPLQHELGTVRTLLAAPWSITPCSSTMRPIHSMYDINGIN